MSKSLGNSLIVFDVLERIRAIELRWYLVSAHYRSNLEFSDEALQESGATFRRIEGFIKRASEVIGEESIANVTIDPGFSAAMNDDLGVPAALAVVHEIVTEGNIELQKGTKSDLKVLSKTLLQVRAMLDVLGVDPLAENWNSSSEDSKVLKEVIDALVANQLQMRQQAREHKDFAKADEIRDSLANAGIAIDDTQNGARWSVMESEN
jgi:cysteinyl-tRNA synthetase